MRSEHANIRIGIIAANDVVVGITKRPTNISINRTFEVVLFSTSPMIYKLEDPS